MSRMITRCPACETAFRITRAQVKTARGAVRCGSCLRIFKASEHLVSSEPHQATDAAKSQEAAGESNMLRFDRESDVSKKPSTAGEDEILIDDGDPLMGLDAAQPAGGLFERREQPREEWSDTGDNDESWAVELLEEEAHSEPRTEAGDQPARPAEPEPELHTEPLPGEKSSSHRELETLLDADLDDRSELLNRIEPEPVEFASYGGRNWRRILLWSSLSLLGVILLAAQVAWLQFERLARNEPYRSVYSAVCPTLGCELPGTAAPQLIRTSNLVVRSHPRADDALMVDAILLNTATFEQPFPDLVLRFSDQQGEAVAARRFTPDQYLAGELAGRDTMPSNRPVHLTLELLDPGPEAVNYDSYIPRD